MIPLGVGGALVPLARAAADVEALLPAGWREEDAQAIAAQRANTLWMVRKIGPSRRQRAVDRMLLLAELQGEGQGELQAALVEERLSATPGVGAQCTSVYPPVHVDGGGNGRD